MGSHSLTSSSGPWLLAAPIPSRPPPTTPRPCTMFSTSSMRCCITSGSSRTSGSTARSGSTRGCSCAFSSRTFSRWVSWTPVLVGATCAERECRWACRHRGPVCADESKLGQMGERDTHRHARTHHTHACTSPFLPWVKAALRERVFRLLSATSS